MNNKKVRTFFPFFCLVFLCVIWGLVLQDKIGEDYVLTFFYMPFIVYIPLTICSIGIILWCVSSFTENKIQKRFSFSAISLIALGIVFSFASIIGISSYNKTDKNIQLCASLNQKYAVQNFADTPALVEDSSCQNMDANFIALGNTVAYHSEKNYICNTDKWFSLEISAYEFQNPPQIYKSRIQKYLEKEYFHWTARIGYSGGEYSKGEKNGKQYVLYSVTQSDDTYTGEIRNYSYIAILVQDKDSISLMMLKAYYTKDYDAEFSDVIEKMCQPSN